MLHCFGLIVSDGSKDRIEFIFRVLGLLEPGNESTKILQNEGVYCLPQYSITTYKALFNLHQHLNDHLKFHMVC